MQMVRPAQAAIELIGGPQDGGKINTHTMTDGTLPTIFIGPRWLGDGFVAFSRESCDRFPIRHDFDGQSYRFVNQESEPTQ